MKKITFSLAVLLALNSCKNESKETQTEQPQQTEQTENPVVQSSQDEIVTPVSPFLNPNAVVPPGFLKTGGVYEGIGEVTSQGAMNYNILMPLLETGSYSFVQFYNLGNNVLFMQMQDDDFQPSTENVIYTLREDISSLNFDLERQISVYLYFENGKTLSKAEAIKVYKRGCTSMTEPRKCGTGILNFSDK